ncbi:Dabb family protein [Bremerella cremea]|uniref:Stress responsive alpha-beta barrel domain-containing protein n=2 Tax=Pirellulales TaxID=2691354 RepID=A0A2S8FDK7_9BACT|nr:stress responsive alpha-beta barrel domain-containing protein [Blastopirellula marina]RCS43598.1 Dabb family protein [Bremerella cremea]
MIMGMVSMTSLSQAEEKEPSGKLRHVVVFKFKESASAKDIEKVEKAFSALPEKIPQIKEYEWGTNNSPEMLDKGFTHCFLVTFASEKDREIYLPHPEHKKFVSILGPYLDEAFVIDYWAK